MRAYDEDNDGYITVNEFRQLVSVLEAARTAAGDGAGGSLSGGDDDPGTATWRRFDYASERSVRAVPTQVRRRGANASDGAASADATLEEVADGPPAHQKDPILLFGGLVPPPLRKAKQDFSAALEQAILAANAVREILAAERAIAASGAAASSER